MSYTTKDLDSAIDKLGQIDLTDAEIEAIADALGNIGDVEGFARQPKRAGERFLLDLNLKMGDPTGGSLKLGDPTGRNFTATDDLAH